MNQSTDCGRARTTDPSTSHKAAKIRRLNLREQIIDKLRYNFACTGWTGKELALHMDRPLNSITPRFAELVRDGSIRDSGQRRDGQIVWVLV